MPSVMASEFGVSVGPIRLQILEKTEVAARKQSLVCLAADRNTMSGLFDLIVEVGSHIAALKTHGLGR